MAITQDLLRGALEGGPSPLLDHLGWSAPAAPELTADRRALLRVAAACRRVFPLPVPNAPGLYAFGAEFDPATLAGEAGLGLLGTSGLGLDPGRAFAACMGETAELMAQVETPGDRAAGRGPLTAHRWPDGAPREVLRGRALRCAGAPPPPSPLSIGCATARSPMEAHLAAAMELVERDAVALWWRGGRRPRPIGDIAAEAPLRKKLEAGARLLDITTENGVPAVAAISFRADGAGFCCGTAARADLAAAARAALVELCQNELAILLVEARRSTLGEAALNPRDRIHLRRHAGIRDGAVPILRPEGAPALPGPALPSPALPGPALPGHDAAARLDALAARLGAAGMELLFLDHTRPGTGLPVLRALIPGLACEPSTDIPPRLAEAITRNGGGPGIELGILLFA